MEQEACGGMRQSDTERCREIQSNTEQYREIHREQPGRLRIHLSKTQKSTSLKNRVELSPGLPYTVGMARQRLRGGRKDLKRDRYRDALGKGAS